MIENEILKQSYVNGYLNYTGSKFKLLDQIIPEMDYSKNTFIDLFAGSFCVGANVVDKYDKVLANDIISELVGIHRDLLESDDIVEKTKLICPRKDDAKSYYELRDSFNSNKTSEKLWALILSCNSNMMRFNKSFLFNQTHGKRQWNSSTDIKVKNWTEHIRKYKNKILLKSGNFNQIEFDSNTMIYADPPYAYIEDKNGNMGNKQISEAGYNSFFSKEDDINLYKYLLNADKIGASFIISGVINHNNKTSWILNRLKKDGFRCIEIKCNYNKISKIGNKETTEVILKNF